FRGRLDRAAVIEQMAAATRMAKAGGVATVGVNAEDGAGTGAGYPPECAAAAGEAGADRVRYCDTIGGDTPWRIRERFADLAATVGIPVETHCHNDLGMAVANSVAGALGDLDVGALALSGARRCALWAPYAFGGPLPLGQPGVGANAFAHESGIHADGALKDRHNYELSDDAPLGPFPPAWAAP